MARQLTLLADVLPSAMENCSITNSVIEHENPALMRYLKRDKSEGGRGNVNEYYSPNSDNHYYRFSYRLGNRIKHRHIPGGNTCSKLAIARVNKIRQMIARDLPTSDILQRIAGFSKGED